MRKWSGSWGMTVHGSEGAVWLTADHPPKIYLKTSPATQALIWQEGWTRWEADPGVKEERLETNADRMDVANHRVVDDWLMAIAENRQPACSGEAAMKSLELIHGVFRSGLRNELNSPSGIAARRSDREAKSDRPILLVFLKLSTLSRIFAYVAG